jgi:ABC-2 type transport system ATP-binding protein
MIVANHLTKRFGPKTAVDDVSFTVHPGKVTGFLGPNGAGKSTTMRMIVGLDRPTSGEVTVDGKRYRDLRSPMTDVGALLDAEASHAGRSARSHLRGLAATHGIGRKRVEEVIELAGLQSVAGKRASTFSLGMGQRLGLAAALLGDPATLILDEPINGLDPEGVIWVRELLRKGASEGRTVFLSSHLMSEMAQVADRIIVLGRGKILADGDLPDLVREWTTTTIAVRSPRLSELVSALTAPGVTITPGEPGTASITGTTAEAVGDLAASLGIPLHELTPQTGTLEDAFLALTGDAVEYRSPADAPAATTPEENA